MNGNTSGSKIVSGEAMTDRLDSFMDKEPLATALMHPCSSACFLFFGKFQMNCMLLDNKEIMQVLHMYLEDPCLNGAIFIRISWKLTWCAHSLDLSLKKSSLGFLF